MSQSAQYFRNPNIISIFISSSSCQNPVKSNPSNNFITADGTFCDKKHAWEKRCDIQTEPFWVRLDQCNSTSRSFFQKIRAMFWGSLFCDTKRKVLTTFSIILNTTEKFVQTRPRIFFPIKKWLGCFGLFLDYVSIYYLVLSWKKSVFKQMTNPLSKKKKKLLLNSANTGLSTIDKNTDIFHERYNSVSLLFLIITVLLWTL